MLTDPFTKAVSLLNTIESEGYEAYFVGGCVRDLLLRRSIKDIDIASSASPETIQRIFDKVIPVGIEHGTVIVRLDGVSYEVTTYRIEGPYSDQRHPDNVTFTQRIEGDLKRRDFTMNALAMDKHGIVIDLFNGKCDLKNRIIRSVGNASHRFKEDPLRIIRALRFSSQLGFSIETETLTQIKKLKGEVESVAIERVANELTLLFQGEFIQNGFTYLLKTELDKHLPIFKANRHLFKKVPQPLSPFHSFGEVITLFHYVDKTIDIPTWTRNWKCSNKVKNEAYSLYKAISHYEKSGVDNWLIYQLNKVYFHSFIHLIELLFHDTETSVTSIQKIKSQLVIQTKKELSINGNDVMQLFPNRTRGPWLSELINNVEKEVVLNGLINTKYAIKEWIRCHPPEIN